LALIIVLIVVLLSVLIRRPGLSLVEPSTPGFIRHSTRKNSEAKTLLNHLNTWSNMLMRINLICDDQNRIVQVNDRAQEAHVYTQDEIIGLSFTSLIAEEDLAVFPKPTKNRH